jgi:DNA repair photolyase
VSEAYVPEGFQGRGAAGNPPNRFERLHYEPDPDAPPGEGAPKTELYRDATRSIVSKNDSPDVPFTYSVNPYRGCEHGCIYCYARPTHEYLGFSAGLDFETRLLVKEDAPRLLEEALLAPSWKPETVVMSGVTDCYQPVERRLSLTRRCLEVFAKLRHPVAVITKNELVTRDLDVLSALAAHGAAGVSISLTTLDDGLARAMEPRASAPARRLAAIRAAADVGVPVGVMLAPVIPGLTDHEVPALLAAAWAAGARSAGFIPLRLPFAVAPLFSDWLERRYPLRKEKVLSLVREVRGGALNDPRFGSRMTGEGPYALQMRALFDVAARRAGFTSRSPALSAAAFRRPPAPQRELFTDGA